MAVVEQVLGGSLGLKNENSLGRDRQWTAFKNTLSQATQRCS